MKNPKYTSSSASCGTRHCSSHPTSSSRRPSHFLQQEVSQHKGLVVAALDPAFNTTSHVGRWGSTVTLLFESFAAADKPIKEGVIPENLQSVSGWLQTW